MTIGERTRTATPAPASLHPWGEPLEAREQRLHASRRLDWRFLLPVPALDRVVYFGPPDGALLDSLRQFSSCLVTADEASPDDAGRFDLAVVDGASAHALQMAVQLLRPGGRIYVESGGAFARRDRGLRPHAVCRWLRRLGLPAPHMALHWPDFERCTRIIPIQRAALRHAVHSGMLGGAVAPVAPLLRPSVVEWFAPAISVTAATMEPAGGAAMSSAGAFLATRRDALAPVPRGVNGLGASTLITPRFRASSHVISLVPGQDGWPPALAVKAARLPGDRSALDREASNLRALQASRRGGFDTIPQVVAYEEYAGHPLLVETAIAGTLMHRAVVRRHPDACSRAVFEWIVEVHSATRREPDHSWLDRLVESPLARLARVLDGDAACGEMVCATRETAERLRRERLPLVFEHGDLSHPNILLTEAREAAVLDWESAEPAGLPLCDLIFALTYIAVARRPRWSRQTEVQAFADAFWGRRAWARPYLRRYADRLAVPSSAIDALVLLTWPRYLDGLLARTGGDSAAAARWLQGNRYFALWRDACARVGSRAEAAAATHTPER
jgi:aminoglycoside phosphotransferase